VTLVYSTVSFVLGDEVFDIRVEAIKVLGRLARLNPAAVLPPLRQHLLHLISGISYTHDIKQKEECIVMLTSFLAESSLQRIVKPFMHTIVHSLPLRDDVRLATAGLEAMGALCLVMREDMILYVDKLIPVIIENMQDQSSARKQEVSICTLGQLVGATGTAYCHYWYFNLTSVAGHVIRPYLQYPTLLPRALDLIMQNSTGTPWSLRREVLRTVGILGALDPFKFNLILEHLQRQKQRKAQAETTGGGAPHTGTPLGSTPNASAGNVSRKNPSVGVGPRTFPCAPGAGSLAQETGQTISISIPSGVSPNATNRGKELLQPGAGGLMREEDEDLIPAHQVMYEQSVMTAQPVPVSAETIRLTPTNPDYYPRVVINALMKIMRDTSLSMHHSAVTQAVMSIFRSLGLKSVPFLDHIIPYMGKQHVHASNTFCADSCAVLCTDSANSAAVQVVRQCGPGLRESLLQQFSALAVILKQHLAPFLPGIFDIICEYWHENLEQVTERIN
jgi:FKBP12-rapamycin complex-associated protein